MNARRSPDAIVVGAGIVGAASAYELARGGLRVLLLERGFAGSGTTAAGMGHVLVMDDSEAQFGLTSYSRSLWLELAPELTADCEWDPCGTLWLAEDEAQLDLVQAKHVHYERRRVRSEVLDARTVAEAEPQLKAMAGALLVPDDAVVYPPAAARWFLRRALERGAEVREGCEVREVTGESVLTAAGERWYADVVINAAGAAAAQLTPELPILPRKGHLAITDRYPGFIRHQLVELGYLRSAHVLTASSVAFNLQPRVTGQVLIGSSRELVGWDASFNRDVLREMITRAASFVPGIGDLSVIRCWTGFRPATTDKLPLVGALGERGPWIAAGHEGLGITTATGSARLLADLVLGRRPAIEPEPLAPSRALVGVAA